VPADARAALGAATERDGPDPRGAPRGFAFDVLIAHSCGAAGAVLATATRR
jgi:hypothetical protein